MIIRKLFLVLTPLVITACSSIQQTNDLPTETLEKVVVHNGNKTKYYYLNLDKKKEFEKFVIKEFETFEELDNDYDTVCLDSTCLNRKIVKPSTEYLESRYLDKLWAVGYEYDKKKY
ncbi:hypothetical protein [Campylobacter sp. RM12651]|uniref:hypothetical protein n=1 Tax=Campylobacter sp. RM12651 TaxID=1660079 RepID=UPI001EFC2533|nr:hypothetical protein [Campylobacter sp. RM12651]ULO04500.1 hypothetical protein AVBRAN_a0018 [Campylobacter sp. RM12651]